MARCKRCKECRRAVSMRPTCGGRALCLAPWLAVLLTALFFAVLFVRCSCGGRSCGTSVAAAEQPPVLKTLMYHHLLPKAQAGALAGNSVVTYTEDFEAQLCWLSQNGWESVTAAQAAAYYRGDAALPQKSVLITFDDGYLSNAVYAAPLLRQYGAKATVFLVTGAIKTGEQTFSAKAVQMMTRETLEANADVFEYAAHTHDLHRATGAGRSALTDATAQAAAEDLRACQALLGTLRGGNPQAFSYPYGFSDEKTRTLLSENGVQIAFLADEGSGEEPPDLLKMPRYPVDYTVSTGTFASYFE